MDHLGAPNSVAMRASQKLAMTDAVARELEKRYSFNEIDTYLGEFQIPTPYDTSQFSDKARYVKMTPRGIEAATLVRMAEDLEIAASTRAAARRPPRNWPDETKFRLSSVTYSPPKRTLLACVIVSRPITSAVSSPTRTSSQPKNGKPKSSTHFMRWMRF